ncbi:Rv1679 family acyl-CoA dehydrogenase [Mycobacterium riyadhense]|uniref:Acyl-CoA dehydrogenase n=1 Tax=Mycobacterium riyadhense TaxID=486698 RepID=A0A1X2CCC2_9MYCO|nr:acyl-CoA dehydrogenase family protein [Mycobacterium riyadhense]MCV7146751.1 acyl-CoA/acyl-ACP dehydrogenase [Mycobacterium riyadhense]ORW73434.1 acyl-CoA dehydrogenase [Mycobacterium riyadhense]
MAAPEALQEVLAIAAEHAERVDTDGAFPAEAVDALRRSGLLGLVLPSDIGGMGAGPVEFTEVVAQLSAACGSTAMIYLMHVAAAVTAAAAPPGGLPDLLADMASGKQLGTLAFSERGSRSHFWAPVSTSSVDGDEVVVQADKSWVTSAGFADVYVVSAGSANGAAGDVDLYAVPAHTTGLRVSGTFTGMGLRGNASAPMSVDIRVPASYRLGAIGGGFAAMMETVLPWFNLGNAAVSLGLATAATGAAVKHVATARLEHLGGSLAELPTIRAQIARMGTALAAQKAYLTLAANSVSSPDDTTLANVLGVKASANDAALTITESAMRVCGGAAFSKQLPIERAFRDARAGSVMAPTADALYDFYGRALTGLPLF